MELMQQSRKGQLSLPTIRLLLVANVSMHREDIISTFSDTTRHSIPSKQVNKADDWCCLPGANRLHDIFPLVELILISSEEPT